MENGEFLAAVKALRAGGEGPIPPPHALWRLGRWLLEKGHPRRARIALERFTELYPNHLDRAEVLRDLARALAAAGRREDARAVAERALAARGDKAREAELKPVP